MDSRAPIDDPPGYVPFYWLGLGGMLFNTIVFLFLTGYCRVYRTHKHMRIVEAEENRRVPEIYLIETRSSQCGSRVTTHHLTRD
ncbi:unnamed protein product, partial [Mesorhabditis spiculigera]